MTTKVIKTPLCKELMKIRIDSEISRAKMAKDLKMTDRQLATIEAGKAEITDAFLMMVADKYCGDKSDEQMLDNLRLAAIESVETISFDMKGLSLVQKSRVATLKRAFESEFIIAKSVKKIKKQELPLIRVEDYSESMDAVSEQSRLPYQYQGSGIVFDSADDEIGHIM